MVHQALTSLLLPTLALKSPKFKTLPFDLNIQISSSYKLNLSVHILYNSTCILCVFVCVCLSVPLEISGTGDCIAMLCTPSSRASSGEFHKLLFEPTRGEVQEKKPLQVFRQFRAESCIHTITLPVTLCRMNLTHFKKAVETSSKGTHLRTHPSHNGYHSCHCFSHEWAIDTPCE